MSINAFLKRKIKNYLFIMKQYLIFGLFWLVGWLVYFSRDMVVKIFCVGNKCVKMVRHRNLC